MRILVDFQNSSGGAPRSLKEHALLLKESGHEIIAVIYDNKEFLDNTNFVVINLHHFTIFNVYRDIVLIFKYYRLIKREKIDIIYSNRILQCQFLSIISDFTGVPILNARAGGFKISNIIRIQKDKHYIVYSDENWQTFKKFGFSDNQLFLVRNRIPIPFTDNVESKIPNKEFVITITGSIKKNTLKGLLWFLKFIQENSFHSDMQYQVNIAGGNILKTTKEKIEFKKAITKTQNLLPSNWQINQLGWVKNITELQARSHICIGKGRSLIQPAMIGKIAFVISENDTLYRCKKDNYNDLRFYNFSGRGKIKEKTDSMKEFLELLSNRSSFLAYDEEANALMSKIKEDYATEYAREKLNKIINYVNKNQKIQNGWLKGFKKILLFYSLTITNKVNNNNNNGNN